MRKTGLSRKSWATWINEKTIVILTRSEGLMKLRLLYVLVWDPIKWKLDLNRIISHCENVLYIPLRKIIERRTTFKHTTITEWHVATRRVEPSLSCMGIIVTILDSVTDSLWRNTNHRTDGPCDESDYIGTFPWPAICCVGVSSVASLRLVAPVTVTRGVTPWWTYFLTRSSKILRTKVCCTNVTSRL